MRQIVVIAHNLRSCYNVGSLFRTAEGLGVSKIYLTGYTPYPLMRNDPRMPHIAKRLDSRICKVALGAEKLVAWEHATDIVPVIKSLRNYGYRVAALEQTASSVRLPNYQPPDKVALVLGREVEGIEPEVLDLTHEALTIPMLGQKESFNVIQAAAMALYHCRYAKS